MSEMIERVAKAISDVGNPISGDFEEWRLAAAKAAIEAMREPTQAIVDIIAFPDFPGDWEVGKTLQRKLGTGVIYPKTELEITTGQWVRAINEALK